uniref:hypothetical protein n=1 Tax=Chitinimonas sp. TaxID=1934313 RepID=UPI0035B148E5
MSLMFSVLCAACMAKMQQGTVVDLAPVETVVQPGKVHQECARLLAGENIRYGFEASAPLAVSVSYQDGDKQVAGSETVAQISLMQRFTAEAARNYCVNWRNAGNQPITIKYRYTPEYHIQAIAPQK